MKIKNSVIGIWGYGLVGESAARFLASQGAKIVIFDTKKALKQAPFFSVRSLKQLFEADYILSSPGVDTRSYRSTYAGKWLSELDLFQQFFFKKIIAITGSVGKTTITHQLTHLLKQAGWRVQAAGNIGLPCLELITRQSELDAVVLEVSSFQLEWCQSFAPDLALWTNFYPNHLDRHGSMDQYFSAKYNLIRHQGPNQRVIVPMDLLKKIQSFHPRSILHSFDPQLPSLALHSGFNANNILLEKALSILKVSLTKSAPLPALEHRLEKVATINGVTFYNDSKSTTPTSTLAAVEQLEQKSSRILLLLGGLSKGIDRSELIKKLKHKNILLLCFGAEAKELFHMCRLTEITAFQAQSLKEAFNSALAHAKPDDITLLSPAGSSFDEFKNYEDRGRFFKELITHYHENVLRNS